jgi:hypothetical protein
MMEFMTGQTCGLYRRDKTYMQNFDGESPGNDILEDQKGGGKVVLDTS